MKFNDIHLIKGDINALFHYPSFTLIEVNNLVFDIFTKIKNNESIETIAKLTKIKQNDIDTLITNMSKSLPTLQKEESELEYKKERSIYRITLHIANGCNLKCSYCYADSGNYGLPSKMMTIETASKFVEFCTTHFEKIGNIVFFGGEPLLNPKVIEYICKSFENMHKEKKINYMPEWGIITNGTILNDNVMKLIKRYIKFITVSIDGPQKLNDFNRKFKNGKGSYSKISDFITKIKKETDVFIKYEATYTSYHRQNNWNESDISSFLKNEFNIIGSVVPDINYQDYFNTKKITNNSYPEGFFGILNSMAHKVYKEMCPVGKNIVAVSTDGEIYPCHMNNGKKHLSLGNISDKNIFNTQQDYILRFPFLKSLLKTEKPCTDCWAKPICGGCVMRWFYNNKTDDYNLLPHDSLCKSNKEHIENILLLIVKLKKDNIKWAELLENLKTLDDYDYYR
jgi:uncharacterized protein